MNFPLKTFVLRKIARTMKLFNFSLKEFLRAASCEWRNWKRLQTEMHRNAFLLQEAQSKSISRSVFGRNAAAKEKCTNFCFFDNKQ